MAKAPSSKSGTPTDPWSDPQFLFTLVSLAMSMSVFLYFLKQLLCASAEDWRELTGEDDQPRKKTTPPSSNNKTIASKPTAASPAPAKVDPATYKKVDPPVEPAAVTGGAKENKTTTASTTTTTAQNVTVTQRKNVSKKK
eukprot:PhF_6_TR39813/c0_g1_i1/m.59205